MTAKLDAEGMSLSQTFDTVEMIQDFLLLSQELTPC